MSGFLFDRRAEKKRLIRVTLTDSHAVVLPAIEDMIADRLAQHAVASPTDDSRLLQARALFKIAATIDMRYLINRIMDEQGDPALLGLEPKSRT